MLVPAVAADGGAKQLDEAHAALDQAAGDQAFPAEDLCGDVGIVEAVEPCCRWRFVGEVHELGDGRLHAIGQFVVGDCRLKRVMMADAAEHALVERPQAGRACVPGRSGWVRSG